MAWQGQGSHDDQPIVQEGTRWVATADVASIEIPETLHGLLLARIDQLPDDMIDGLDNVVFVVEGRSEPGTDLLGLYDGFALTERDRYGMGELPDRIIVYREAHLAACDTVAEVRDEVHTTLVHEIAHFYGIDDDRLHELGWA